MPNGKQQKQNRPYGEMNVVNRVDSTDKGICQNPELASRIENAVAPESWASICSMAGNGCLSRHTFSFNLVRSTQYIPCHSVLVQPLIRHTILWVPQSSL